MEWRLGACLFPGDRVDLVCFTSLVWFSIFLINALPCLSCHLSCPLSCVDSWWLSRIRWRWSLVFPCYRDLWVSVPLCLLWSWSSRALQARVGRRHSTQAAEHVIPFFTQGGRGEWLPSDCYKQSHCCQRSQPQGPGYVFYCFIATNVHLLHELGMLCGLHFSTEMRYLSFILLVAGRRPYRGWWNISKLPQKVRFGAKQKSELSLLPHEHSNSLLLLPQKCSQRRVRIFMIPLFHNFLIITFLFFPFCYCHVFSDDPNDLLLPI